MRVARLARRQFADLSGIGASIAGARWNSEGKRVAYTSSCGALAVLEYLAHVPSLSSLPAGLMIMQIEIPDTLKIERVHSIPADEDAFRRIGDDWLDSRATPVLEVPSVLVPRQKNYLINPAHALFDAISIIERNPFALDNRLLSGFVLPEHDI